ncbi:MAG: slipin family protein [Phycisphaerales bacterium]|nr:slipin family protein [Phycisphaerales bacterium]
MRLVTRVRTHEVALWFRHGDLYRVLGPGAHLNLRGLLFRIFGVARDRIEIVDTLPTRFEHDLLDVLAADPRLVPRLTVVDLKDDERALVWKDGRLGWVLGPGRHAFWNRPARLEVETHNVGEFRVSHPRLEALLNHPGASRLLHGIRVDAHEQALLFRDGELVELLDPGIHVFWKGAAHVTWKSVDRRERILDVSGQEIMTADKVTLRVNLLVTFVVTDVVRAGTVVSEYDQSLYRAAQLALRESVGVRPLDRLLADKDQVGAEVRNAIAERASELGMAVRSVGLRDVILPGDMKVILNEVILAQKRAEANLIRRREETAAARSQANTARLLAENPVLARMKELEALQEILSGARATFVLGRGDLLTQVRGLIDRDVDAPGKG